MEKSIPHSLFTDFDISLFKSGNHFKLYEKMGSHPIQHNDVEGTYFAVWAPNARKVSVIGDFNNWDREAHELYARWDGSGIWEAFVPHAVKGQRYKYAITTHWGQAIEKGDPYARLWETPPQTASVIWEDNYKWKDAKWVANRALKNGLDSPISAYEVHLGSWMRNSDGTSLSYDEMADKLVAHVKEMGFTHVEMMPVMEHPFFGSWGYQVTGYFAPSSRYGRPDQFKALVDKFHEEGIGVILDWVPSHFPNDAHGLFRFDGTALYEHEDPRLGYHPDWNSYIFNYGRFEVRSFLISNAMYWLDQYHADGLRVDAVASMLYLDYSRKHGQWIPNKYGGNQNLESISLLRTLNEAVYKEFPDIQMIAEESTAFAGVSRPVYSGGLGFGLKWMMGWMHDTLKYMAQDPLFKRYHHNTITFSTVYAFSENFMLPLSHDEVVHGKGSLLSKMPGDMWSKFANLRLMYAYMFTHPGSKLLFMGGEFGQTAEWNHDYSLRWDQYANSPHHKGVAELIKALNNIYKNEPAAYRKSYSPEGFQWVDNQDWQRSIIAYLRKSGDENDNLLVIVNFTPVAREDYIIGIPKAGTWEVLLNSDDELFGGKGFAKTTSYTTFEHHSHGCGFSLKLELPGFSALILKRKA